MPREGLRPRTKSGKAVIDGGNKDNRLPSLETKRQSSQWWLDVMELFSWNFSMLFWGFLYNGVGELAAMRGVDYSEIIRTRYDTMVEVMPVMVVPYFLVYFHPTVFSLAIMYTRGVRKALPAIRRFYFTQITLMSVSYFLYIALPTDISSISLRDTPPPADADFLTVYNYRFIHQHMTLFNACPSMHVAHTLSMAIVHTNEGVPLYTGGIIFAILTFFSTVLTRAHFIMDVPCGILVAYGIDTFLYRPWKQRKTPSRLDVFLEGLFPMNRVILFLTAPVLILLLNEYLAQVTGVRVDMIGMLLGVEGPARH